MKDFTTFLQMDENGKFDRSKTTIDLEKMESEKIKLLYEKFFEDIKSSTDKCSGGKITQVFLYERRKAFIEVNKEKHRKSA